MSLQPGQTAEVERVVTFRREAGGCVMTAWAALSRSPAWDEVEKIAEGRHERFVVPSLARFLERAAGKTPRKGGPSRAS